MAIKFCLVPPTASPIGRKENIWKCICKQSHVDVQVSCWGWVWIALKLFLSLRLAFFCGSCALFMRSVSTDFSKSNFKIGSHNTIHTFKNYFVTVFLVFSNKWYPNRPCIMLIIRISFVYIFPRLGQLLCPRMWEILLGWFIYSKQTGLVNN